MAKKQKKKEKIEKKITELAYQIHLERGGEHGQDFEDWLKAEKEIRGKKGKKEIKNQEKKLKKEAKKAKKKQKKIAEKEANKAKEAEKE